MILISQSTPQTKQPFVGEHVDKLFAHQLSTLYELKRLETEQTIQVNPDTPAYQRLKNIFFCNQSVTQIKLKTNIGILASPTGTGKTHPMVALAMNPFSGGDLNNQSYQLNQLVNIEAAINYDLNRYLHSTLIIVPKNIFFQWLKVIEMSGATYHQIYTRIDLDKFIWSLEYPNQAVPQIVLCKHTLYNELVAKKKYWSRVILDEADTITIPNSKPIEAGFVWLVTATADHLEKHPHKGFWRGIVSSLYYPHLYQIKIDQVYAAECLRNTNISRFNILCQGINNMEQIAQFLPRRIQEMLAVGDYSAAVATLGGQEHSTQSLIDLIVRYFKVRIDSTSKNIEQAISLGHKHDDLDQRLKDLNERLNSIVEQINNVTGQCAICHDQNPDISLVQCCFQVFCTECIVSWMGMRVGQSCPYCKHENPKILKINTAKPNAEATKPKANEEDLLDQQPKYNKYQTLPKLIDYLLKSDPKAKIIVVTSYNMTAFEQQLENNHYRFNTLNHVSHVRTVREYNQGISPIILLDAKYNGAGIDLEQTTAIIYMQQLEANLMAQTEGRAIRLSRPDNLPLKIFYLVSDLMPNMEAETIDRFIKLDRLAPVKPKIPRPSIKIKPRVVKQV